MPPQTSAIVLSVGMLVTVFKPIRQCGVSILASAGIAGIIVGLAAVQRRGGPVICLDDS
ncbi:MAG: hypothetical protein ABI634_18205 [Acidobacteriota bacterium]